MRGVVVLYLGVTINKVFLWDNSVCVRNVCNMYVLYELRLPILGFNLRVKSYKNTMELKQNLMVWYM